MQSKTLVLDIETNSTYDKIWVCVTHDMENGTVCHTESTTLIRLLDECDTLVGHNLIGFDLPILEKLWKVQTNGKNILDTLIMSRLLNPSIDDGHSLDAWSKRLGGKKKSDYQRLYWRAKGVRTFDRKDSSHWDNPDIGLMTAYCKRDVAVTCHLFDKLTNELEGWGESVQLEHEVAKIIKEQEDWGFRFDTQKAQALLAILQGEIADIENNLQTTFPPKIEERWSEKTGKRLADRVTIFNPGSRQQIAERLIELGADLKQKTEKGAVVINENTLAHIDLPEAKLIARYLLLQKRVSQISSWFDVVKDDGRVHGRVITNGAVTGRMTHHSPNMAQVPNAGSEYGKECRECWTVDDGNVLVGADASGLELRMLAHYMRDPAYAKAIIEGSSKDGSDIHTKNQKAAGLATRDQAKTFIYAFLYGAGAAKIGSIVGGDAKAGKKLIEKFLRATPAISKLKDKVAKHAEKGSLPGLDGRKLLVRSEHSALNTLLQGAGAIVMKKALVILHNKLKCARINAHFTANVHDEWQIEVEEQHGEEVGRLAVESIKEAGEHFSLRCPLSGEFSVGRNWKETH